MRRLFEGGAFSSKYGNRPSTQFKRKTYQWEERKNVKETMEYCVDRRLSRNAVTLITKS